MGICKNASAGGRGQGKALSAPPLALGVALALVAALGAASPAYAATDTYTNLIPTDSDTQADLDGKRVTFNGVSWYVIGDDSRAQDAGTLTLFAAGSLGGSAFDSSSNRSNAYGTSTVKAYLDAMTAEGGSFHGVSSAIVGTNLADVGVTGAKLYLLSRDEAKPLPLEVLNTNSFCWLRTPGTRDDSAAIVWMGGYVVDTPAYGEGDVDKTLGVRPALKLNLESVIFKSASKSFFLNLPAPIVTRAPEATNPTYTGEPQVLVTVGEAEGGTVAYSTDGGKAWSEKVPTATDPGDYEVQWKVFGDDSHSDTEPASVTSTIGKVAVETREMHRLYNPYTGEHFYTANAEERDSVAAAGWEYEGVGWVAPTEGAPVFRVYNPFAGDHHYTTSEAERDKLVSVGWVDEGVGWRSAGEDGVPLWRQYNPNAVAGAHNYTTNEFERDSLVSIGWHDEGIGWYGVE